MVEYSSLLQQFLGPDATSKGSHAKFRGGKVTLDQLIEFCDTGAEVGKGQAKLMFEFMEGTGSVARSCKGQEVDEALKLSWVVKELRGRAMVYRKINELSHMENEESSGRRASSRGSTTRGDVKE
jgi:hypothetical protein